MRLAKLITTDSSEKGTFSVLSFENQPLCVTLELPWRANQENISCIPSGRYTCRKYSSKKYPNVWEICNVRDRNNILMHIGNYLHDTHGCILLGTYFADSMVCSSAKAMEKARQTLPDEFILDIYRITF